LRAASPGSGQLEEADVHGSINFTDIHALLSVFAVIFVAELPDKTALAALVLATRHPPLPVWLGASLALTVQSVVAVAAGSLFALLPARAVGVATALAFFVSAVLMWRRHDEADARAADDGNRSSWRSFATTFTVVFIAEWGDLTQVGTAALAAHYRAPLVVLVGSAAALWSVAGVAVFVGNRAAKLLDPHRTRRIAAIVFALVGVAILARSL
jgi:putative Ca2+/H+ antiporter (TMEM165/GDT1 family)